MPSPVGEKVPGDRETVGGCLADQRSWRPRFKGSVPDHLSQVAVDVLKGR